ncbi:MAG TPA: hypothetical protein VGP31_14730, partial [Planosporangium sp.]|nr:hypothetical protein [Planosporangium sp.]
QPEEELPPGGDRPREATPHPPEAGERVEPARDERPPVTIIDPELQKTLADLEAELNLATQWHRLLDERISQVERLVNRVRRLAAVRANPDLVEELNALQLDDPHACLRTVGFVLAEVLALRSAPVGRDGFDAWLVSLDALADRAGKLQPKAVVSPDARGEIDGRLPTKPASDVDVRDSVGVMWGTHNRLRVEHRCVVERPVIEVAELIDMDNEEPIFDWSAWQFTSTNRSMRGAASGAVETSATLRDGYWANIWNCTGITIGDRNILDLTYVYRMTSCRVNLVPLLRDPRVRAELAQCRDDSPENAQQAREARHRLPVTVANAVRAIDVSSLVSEEEVAALAAQMRQPQVRGRAGRIVITHGVGVALGIDPAVSWLRTTRVDRIQVR